MLQRKNNAARKSSLLGRQQRADGRIEAHNYTLKVNPQISRLGFHMPAPGPLVQQGKRKVQFAGKNKGEQLDSARRHILAVDTGTATHGLKYCAALDFVNQNL